ncbi:hypothetical protein WCLP8_20002 [uncultured Gammaproteobacteria bacterium]
MPDETNLYEIADTFIGAGEAPGKLYQGMEVNAQ